MRAVLDHGSSTVDGAHAARRRCRSL